MCDSELQPRSTDSMPFIDEYTKKYGYRGVRAFEARQDPITVNELSLPLGSKDTGHGIQQSMMVRRLTPIECERLQGFPDNHTAIPWRGKPAEQCPDGPRYKALGNSMAVPCMVWIGKRIQMVEEI